MNKFKLITLAILCFGATSILQAQTVDEILANYYENTGGLENWKNVKKLNV